MTTTDLKLKAERLKRMARGAVNSAQAAGLNEQVGTEFFVVIELMDEDRRLLRTSSHLLFEDIKDEVAAKPSSIVSKPRLAGNIVYFTRV
jgi:hypothetical protein